MKIRNPFCKKSPPAIRVPGASDLQAIAEAYVESVINNSAPDQARVIELAVKNGSLSLSIDISPTPAIRINLDPGAPISFETI